MANIQKIPRRQLILLVIMIIIGLLLCRQYLGVIQLPTMSYIESQVKALESAQNDLKVAEVDEQKRLQELEELRDLSNDFWTSSSQRASTEQEITREFNKLLRRAQLPANQKVDIQRNKLPGVNNLQEVQIKLDLKNVTMREITRLLNEVKTTGNRLTWVQCQISPDNPRTPQNVNFSGKLRALVLTPEASEFLLKGQLPGSAGDGKNGKSATQGGAGGR